MNTAEELDTDGCRQPGRSLLITLEGIECSGKTIQAPLLGEFLQNAGWNVRHLREPGGTELGESIRAILKNRDVNIAPLAELFLFSAARAQLVLEVVDPVLRKPNSIALLDRFYDATDAYQGHGRGLQDAVVTLTAIAAPITPDMTFILDIPVDTMYERMASNGRVPDRFEVMPKGFFEKVRSAYLSLPLRFPSRRFCVLDGTLPVSVVHREMCSVLKREFQFPERVVSASEPASMAMPDIGDR